MIYTNVLGGAVRKSLGRTAQQGDAEKRPLVNFAYQPPTVLRPLWVTGCYWPSL